MPPTHAAEMVPFNPLVGEFRVHYAGFFDPGFGHAAAGGTGAKAVLEVRSHKVPFILEDGQIVGRLIYERLTEVPDMLYGTRSGSNYQAPGPEALQALQVAGAAAPSRAFARRRLRRRCTAQTRRCAIATRAALRPDREIQACALPDFDAHWRGCGTAAPYSRRGGALFGAVSSTRRGHRGGSTRRSVFSCPACIWSANG